MIAAQLAVRGDHPIQADQTPDQRGHADSALANLAIGDDDSGLHHVAALYLALQLRPDGLDIHAAIRDLAAYDVDVRRLQENRERDVCDLLVLDALIPVRE